MRRKAGAFDCAFGKGERKCFNATKAKTACLSGLLVHAVSTSSTGMALFLRKARQSPERMRDRF